MVGLSVGVVGMEFRGCGFGNWRFRVCGCGFGADVTVGVWVYGFSEKVLAPFEGLG